MRGRSAGQKRGAGVDGSHRSGRLRIIGGKWRSRTIEFADAPGLRPTGSRIRETLFNWLKEAIPGSCCLDLFAGSGALGFEAASRGARSVVMVEGHRAAARELRKQAHALAAPEVAVLHRDALKWLRAERAAGTYRGCFDIVFLDPPFGRSLISRSCVLLQECGWLAPGALVYLEAERRLGAPSLLPGWRVLRHGNAGEVGYYLTQAVPADSA